MRPSSPTVAPPAATVPLAAPRAAFVVAPVEASQAVAASPSPHRYEVRIGPIPPSPPHPRLTRRSPPPKRSQTSGLGESSSSLPQELHSSPTQGPAYGSPQDHSLGSFIRRSLFHCGPIPSNADCSDKVLHNENFYDIPTFSAFPEL